MKKAFKESSQQIAIYRPNQRHDLGFFKTWAVMAKNIVNSKELIWQLFKRDFFDSYKKTFIGISWIFIAPIAGIVSWVFLQKTGMLHPGDIGIPFVQKIIKWNPLTYLVCSLRDIIIYGRLYDVAGCFINAGLSFLLFMISWRLFYVSEDRIIERMI
jgi:ABC-type polysaccharide/polyol phosphate export permease